MKPGATANIMVVDDQPANLRLLERMLKQQGYRVRSFPRGRLALAAAATFPPDLILLDINMPEMNGFEVCERLKADPSLARIPVIFLSALSQTEDKVKAFRSGGVDYMTKPFQLEEVHSRLKTHLALYRLQQSLQEQSDRFEEMVRARTRELAEAHARLKVLDQSKSDFLRLISHEFRTPLNGLLGIGDLLLMESADAELRNMFDESRRRVLKLLDHALLLTQVEVEAEKFASERVSVPALVSAAIVRASEIGRVRHVRLEAEPTEAFFVLGTAELLEQAVQVLLEAAVKFSAAGETARVACHPAEDRIHIVIETSGYTVPASAIPYFFDLFSVAEAVEPDGDFGLGPPFACRIVQLFDGSVAVENREPSGIRLTASLRRAG